MKKIIKRRSAHQPHGLHSDPLIAKLYSARGLVNSDDSDTALASLYSPESMKGINAAVEALFQTILVQDRILIVGDFDADGATSTALMLRCLREFGAQNVDFLVPNRFEFGYGLTPEIVRVAAEQKPKLIVTVDNGIASLEGVELANELSIDVLVTDHHLPGATLPNAKAIVNPNQAHCTFPSKSLAGVGVVFYLMSALRSFLTQQGWFETRGIDVPNMAKFLDIVALGTVADVVPLDRNNRILVKHGIRRIRAEKCVAGISALIYQSKRVHAQISASDLGFALGPRINAAGRLDDMSLGIRCLVTDCPMEAREIASQLDDLNQDRKTIEHGMQQEAIKILDTVIDEDDKNLPPGLCLYRDDWHQGVIGILASRIKDRVHRPTLVFAKTETGQLKGSGRSIAGIHLRDVLDSVATRHPKLLSKFGGHAMAAGLSLELKHLEEFKEAFSQSVKEAMGDGDFEACIWTDGELDPHHFNLDTAELIAASGPWGQNFPEPVFDGVFTIMEQRLVAQRHLKMRVSPLEHPKIKLDAIAFNVDLDAWPNEACAQGRLVFSMDVNEYQGRRRLQLLIRYIENFVPESPELSAH